MTIRICPERDAACPNGFSCPYARDRYSCDPGFADASAAGAAHPRPNALPPGARSDQAKLTEADGELVRLRELAEKATPGPWQNGIDDLEGVVAPYQPGLGNVICAPPFKRMYSSLESWPDNAAYIAAASPDVILGLLDTIRRLEGERELLRAPAAVHLNMLRGGIARLTPAQVGHIYSRDEAPEVIAELQRQNGLLAEAELAKLKASLGSEGWREKIARVIDPVAAYPSARDGPVTVRRRGVALAKADAIIALLRHPDPPAPPLEGEG